MQATTNTQLALKFVEPPAKFETVSSTAQAHRAMAITLPASQPLAALLAVDEEAFARCPDERLRITAVRHAQTLAKLPCDGSTRQEHLAAHLQAKSFLIAARKEIEACNQLSRLLDSDTRVKEHENALIAARIEQRNLAHQRATDLSILEISIHQQATLDLMQGQIERDTHDTASAAQQVNASKTEIAELELALNAARAQNQYLRSQFR
jgi:hypothetical protein